MDLGTPGNGPISRLSRKVRLAGLPHWNQLHCLFDDPLIDSATIIVCGCFPTGSQDDRKALHGGRTAETTRQITGDDIIAEILRNAEQGVFKIRYTALLPSIYHVYLHPSDYDTISPVMLTLAAETRAALIERLDELNRAAKPSSASLGPSASIRANTSNTRFVDPDWTIEFHPDAEEQLEPRRHRDLFRTRVR